MEEKRGKVKHTARSQSSGCLQYSAMRDIKKKGGQRGRDNHTGFLGHVMSLDFMLRAVGSQSQLTRE